jgi:cellobiose-specific phosphotransferase system component IIA
MIRLAACLAVMTAISTLAPTANAHVNPEEVAHRCVHQVDQILDRCENAAASETQECLKAIRRYRAAGRRDLAIQTARECIQAARERTRHCISAVRDVCTRCIDWLLAHGADRLAARVRNVCADAIEHLENLLKRQENAIRQALDG